MQVFIKPRHFGDISRITQGLEKQELYFSSAPNPYSVTVPEEQHTSSKGSTEISKAETAKAGPLACTPLTL